MSSTKTAILTVDDDKGICTQYRWLLSDYHVFTASDRAQALTVFQRELPPVAIVDLGLPPDPDGASEGLATVDQILKIKPQTKIIVVTGNEDHEFAVKAIASGAYDFFRKPVDPDILKLMIARALSVFALEEENRQLIASMPHSPVAGIVGASHKVRNVLRDAEKIAMTDISALLLGESGTGKELIARAIHKFSARAEKPFIALNCAAIPETLLEAELFGHEKGAFTGALKKTIGKIESAHHGTLFLDEVGDIPLSMQVKILRFLEDKIIERVGGREQIAIDVRILCATNQNIEALIADGRFREDLYYRINEVTLRLPPLREREGDAVLLARYFLQKYSDLFGRSFIGLGADAISALRSHSWPGNVREVENRVKRAVTMADGSHITAADLELRTSDTEESLELREVRRRASCDAVQAALAQSNGNITMAAKLLKISRPTFYDLVKELEIDTVIQIESDECEDEASAQNVNKDAN